MLWAHEMSKIRIYQPSSVLADSLLLDTRASHYLINVLRAKPGDLLTIFNGDGGEYTAVITAFTKKTVSVKVLSFLAREAESELNITLAQGIARGEKMDFIIQKAVELGVKKIIPLQTERCNLRLEPLREEKRLQHWRSIVMSACEQSGRNHLPDISAMMTLTNWLPTIKADQCFVLTPHLAQKLPMQNIAKDAAIILLIGPEGGLTDAEIALARQANFLPLNLGPRILRTETATIAAISIMQYRYGDMT